MDDTGLIARTFTARHMTPEMPFNLKALFTRALIYTARKIYSNDKGKGLYSKIDRCLSYDESVDYIANAIRAGKPFMAGKIGTGDGETLNRYIDIHAQESAFVKSLKILTGERGPFWWDNSIRAGICVCAGVFPNDNESIEEFCRIFMDYCREFDGFARWTEGETRLYKTLCPNATPIDLNAIAPVADQRTWYNELAGKRVLVVHQYPATIRAQYEKNVEFHRGHGPFPRFKELITYRPVNSIGGKCDRFPRWKDALESMMSDVSKIDFDVALLGCGVYGVPLSVHIKRMGKIAIYTGGATQIVFGIKGRRWDDKDIYNEHWVRPFPDDAPANMREIEGGTFL